MENGMARNKTTNQEHRKPELSNSIFPFNSGNIIRTLARKMNFEFVLQKNVKKKNDKKMENDK